MRPAARTVLSGAALLCVATTAGCGGESAGPDPVAAASPASPVVTAQATDRRSAAPPAPRLLTVRDDGRAYATRVGARLSLSLPESVATGDLQVSGAAVDVSEDLSDAPSGQRSWELRPRAAGVADVRVGGFEVELQVELQVAAT